MGMGGKAPEDAKPAMERVNTRHPHKASPLDFKSSSIDNDVNGAHVAHLPPKEFTLQETNENEVVDINCQWSWLRRQAGQDTRRAVANGLVLSRGG